MDYTLLNVASLLFGFIAILVPLIQNSQKLSFVKMMISFSTCLVAVVCQIAYQNYLVEIEDYAAIEDTTGAVLKITSALILLTIILNLWSFLKARKHLINLSSEQESR